MADTKISALTALAGTDVDTGVDSLAIVDDSVTTTKKILAEQLRIALRPVIGTTATTTSGATHDFTSIPAGTRRIVMSFSGVSTDGSSPLIIQIGDSGGVEATGYLGAASNLSTVVATLNFTTGFGVMQGTASTTVVHGSVELTLLDSATNLWSARSVIGWSSSAVTSVGGGSKALSGTLDRVRLTTVNGTDAFDAGSVNIQYQ